MSWNRIARRIRVPLGFAFGILYLVVADPTWGSIAFGAAIAALGLLLRGAASGHVRKDAELTTTGPYAYTRNPLYLGSLIIAAGFAVAARSWWIVLGMTVIFAVIYVPVIRYEEAYLREHFPGFDEYCRRVPRLLPRLSASSVTASGFSPELYWKHREYNAAIGTLAMLAALAVKLAWLKR